jgi:glycosyltransferase involved in cell wall biosynthesis
MKLIVIIPAFNEAKSIGELLAHMPDLKKLKINLQAVVVDDGSSDGTAEIAKKSGAVVLRHTQNEGLGKTIQDGVKYFLEQNADILVNIDADMQYDPKDILKLIQPILDDKADFVSAERFNEASGETKRPAHMSWIKFWGNQVMTKLVNSLAGTQLGDVSSGFRAMNREAALHLNLTGHYTYTHETIIDLAFKGLRLISVPIQVRYFPDRQSRVANNLFQYTSQTLRIILKAFRDYKPLFFFSVLATIPLLMGTAMIIFILIHYFLTGEFSPYKFIGFTGVYLFSLGLLLVIIGFLADILAGMRMTLEKQLYLQKKSMQKKDSWFAKK